MNKFFTFLFLKPTDEIELKRILYFTNSIILMTIAVFAILSVAKIFLPPDINSSDYTIWTLTVVFVIYYILSRNGKVSLAGSLSVITLWLALTYMAWSWEGVKDSAIVGYFVLIQIAIYIRWTWLALSISVMSLASIWALYYAESNKIVIPIVDTTLNYTIDFSVAMIIAITLVYLNAKSFLLYYNRIQKELEDRRKAEEKFQVSEENFHILFDENPLPTVLSEIPSGKIAFVNKRMCAALKMDAKDILGKTANQLGLLNNPVDQERMTHLITSHGFVDNIEVGKTLEDGSNGTDLVFMRMVIISNTPYCLTVVHDITERKMVEQELAKARDRAEESDRLKSAFLTNMSHEIRTPMNGILGFSELLKEPGLTGEDQKEFINIIEKSGSRMLNIINDLVDIAKIESGQMEVSVSEMNVNEQVEYIFDFFKPDAEQKNLQFNFKNTITNDHVIIKSDKRKFNSILSNLVKNAIKFTEQGRIEIGYNILSEMHEPLEIQNTNSLNNQTSLLQFYVKDTGIGIPKDRHQAIFDRFVQADIEDSRAFQGAGLGLSISKAYTEMLGGKIWLESTEGEGSVFYFSIPFIIAADENKTVEKNVSELDADSKVEKLKILIVEDDQISEMVISRIVMSISREILTVNNGLDAVEICRRNPDIDLIMMDIKMPGIDGYETTRKIRQFNKDVIIIAQTSFALLGDREKAIVAGCNDYISKPTRRDLLLEMINRQLSIAN